MTHRNEPLHAHAMFSAGLVFQVFEDRLETFQVPLGFLPVHAKRLGKTRRCSPPIQEGL